MSNSLELYNLEGDFDETLRQYKQAYVNYIEILKNSKSNSSGNTIIIFYNEKLIELNNKIIELLKSTQTDVDSVQNENKKKLVEAQKMYVNLLQEKKKIQQLMEENLTVNTGKSFFETYFQYQYAQYLFWFFLLIIVLLITVTTIFFPNVEIKPLKIIGWALFVAFIIVSALYSYVPAGFLILCLIIAYICLGFLKIVPIP
uniref:Uncharacterized protein n=1 Tax=viral metagenome TaxID=1070528 RepID=A0A6C0LE08_9ZZZZ